jgi:hypothetical protein
LAAFAGESQARTRYTFFFECSKKGRISARPEKKLNSCVSVPCHRTSEESQDFDELIVFLRTEEKWKVTEL